MLAVLPLVPVAYVAGAAVVGLFAGWLKGRSAKRKAEAAEELKRLDRLSKTLEEIRARQRQQEAQHETDLAAQDAGSTETTAEEQAFQELNIYPEAPPHDILMDAIGDVPKDEDTQDKKEEDNYTGDDRFELMDL